MEFSVEESLKNLCDEIDQNNNDNDIIFNLPDPPKIPPTPRTEQKFKYLFCLAKFVFRLFF